MTRINRRLKARLHCNGGSIAANVRVIADRGVYRIDHRAKHYSRLSRPDGHPIARGIRQRSVLARIMVECVGNKSFGV
jgi:hypothetical protein